MTTKNTPREGMQASPQVLRPVRIARPAPGMRPVRARRKEGPRLLLALGASGRPTASLERTLALAAALGAQVHVLRVLPRLSRLQALFSRRDVSAAARAVERTLRANRATRAWLRDALGKDDALGRGGIGHGGIEHVAIAHGELVEQAAAYAATLEASLIVVPAREGRLGKTVTALASAAGVPVLVAHERAGKPAIVAATDLREGDYPVLRKAASLGQRLEARLVAVHNVGSAALGATPVWAVGAPRPPLAQASRAEELAAAARGLPIDAETIVLDELSSADAILAEARAHDADIVVVGTRRRGWLDDLAGSVAIEVVNRAACTVLVLPLDRPRSPAAAITSSRLPLGGLGPVVVRTPPGPERAPES